MSGEMASPNWTPEQLASEYVRKYCGVVSRSELDHDQEAQDKFKTLMAEYNRWYSCQ
jgi:hypothetical protein